MKSVKIFAALCALACSAGALADLNVGVTLSTTGPAASLGIPEKNTFELLPATIAGQKVNWIILDDASDTTRAQVRGKRPSTAPIGPARAFSITT